MRASCRVHLQYGQEPALPGDANALFRSQKRSSPPVHIAGQRSYHAIPVLPHVEIAYALKRMRNGHSQTEIARKLGITYQSYQKLENPRKCNPTVKTLERIGEALGKELVITWR
jgi:antitoxin HicB